MSTDYKKGVQTGEIAGTDANDLIYWINNTGRKIAVIQSSVKIVPHVSVSAHAANVMLFELLNGSDVIADWDTTTGQEGALTAGTPAAMTAGAATGKLLEVADGSCLIFKGTKGGTGPAYAASCAFQYLDVIT